MENFQPRGMSRKPMREVKDTKKPLYIVFILDTSSSMQDYMSVSRGEGQAVQVRKIEELNQGLGEALDSLRKFEASNVFYKVYYQIIELNSYGKALFPDFVPLSLQSEKICFQACGVTCLENSLTTLKSFLDPKHMPGCNRAVNVILMSDGYPTDVEGYVQEEAVYKKTVSAFKGYLEERGLRPNVDLYAIGVGEDACEDMLRDFADDGRYYVVEDMESLAYKLDFVTRKSLVRLTTRAVKPAALPAVEEHPLLPDNAPPVREIDLSRCLGESCQGCIDACPLSAIQQHHGLMMIQPALCVGCGDCESACPVEAIRPLDGSGCDDLL